MDKYEIKRQITEKRAAQQKLMDGCRSVVDGQAQFRDLNPEEKTKFDALSADVDTLKAQVKRLEEIEADEPEPLVASADTRGRVSQHITRSSPAVHGDAAKKPYSLLRAINRVADGQPLDGLEGEIHKEIMLRSGRTQCKGFMQPTGSDPEIRRLMNGGKDPEYRSDFTTTTGTGVIANVLELPMIELLRAKLVIRDLGATILTGLQGLFSIPRQTGSAVVYWLAEGSSATPTAPTTDQVAFTPKVAIAATNLSRKLINQSSVDAEQLVKNDLAASLAHEVDRVAINGSGTNQPLGILQNGSVPVTALGTNGAVPTFGDLVALETAVATANVDSDKLAYLTAPGIRGKLKSVGQGSAGYPLFVYENGTNRGEGTVNGYPMKVTTNVPANLTKGTASGICSAIIFGAWDQLVVGYWEGIDTIVDPYTGKLAGQVGISMEMSVDVQLRRTDAFAIILDALKA